MQFLVIIPHWAAAFSRFFALFFLLIQQLLSRDIILLKTKQRLLIFVCTGVLLEPLILSWGQFKAWQAGFLGQYLLPPHNNIAYFLGYAWAHFWASVVLSFAGAVALFALLRLLMWLRPMWLYDDEPFLGLVSFLISGWPGGLLMLAFVFAAGLGAHVLSLLAKPHPFPRRFALRSFWLSAALVIFLFGDILIKWAHLTVLRP